MCWRVAHRERVEENAPLTPENIRLLNRFTGLLDEEWFLKTHVIIESEAAGVVSAIHDACAAIASQDYDRLLAMLGWLEQSMSHVATNCLWIMFERSEDEGFLCEPDFFFHRFRPVRAAPKLPAVSPVARAPAGSGDASSADECPRCCCCCCCFAVHFVVDGAL